MKKLALQSGGASHFQGFALNAIISAEPPTKVVCLTEVAVAALSSLGTLLKAPGKQSTYSEGGIRSKT